MIGKASPAALAADVFSRTGHPDPAVIQGPAYGEDTAAIDLGDETLVVSSDPISLAASRVGTLGVHVACNDIAVAGADPSWLSVVIVLPGEGVLDEITAQLHDAATDLEVAIVGGHTEYDSSRDRPFLSLTAMGVTDRFVPTGGASPGDDVILTKGAGIEGTAIVASDFADDLPVDDAVLAAARSFFDDLSVLPDARAVRDVATAMHDPTEGGVIDGLLELATASGVAIDVDRDAVPIREETRAVCAPLDLDPLSIFGSGALLAAVPPAETDTALTALADAGIDAAVIGTAVEDDPALVLSGERITEPVRDGLYALWE